MFLILGITLWQIFFAVLSTLPLIYWYLTRNYSHWSKFGVKGPKPVLFFGNFHERISNSSSVLDVKYMKKFGTIYGIFNGTEPVLQIAEPQLIKQVLVKDFHKFSDRRELRTEHPIVNKNLFNSTGDDWKRLRTIMSGTFTSGKMKKMYHMVRKCFQPYLEELDTIPDSGKEIDAKLFYQNFTMDVIACCAFATETNGYKNPNNPFIVNGRKFFEFEVLKVIPSFTFPKRVNKLLNIQTNFNTEANEWLITLSRAILEKRRTGKKIHDFVQILMDAKAGDQDSSANETPESHHFIEGEDEINAKNKFMKTKFENKSLTEDEIIAQCWVFLLAGFETTATTLGYLTYELALNPESQEKLYQEVMSAVDSDGEISYEELLRLPYLDAVISETLRLYPPVMRLERQANENYKLADTGISLYNGQLVEIPVYAIHHSEMFYKNANKFIPERFLSENRHQMIPYTYFPFGSGPRNCIGMRFALMEVKLAVAHIVMRYTLSQCSKTDIPLKFAGLTPLLAAERIVIQYNKR